jgi:iron complex transport system substrate-binding protein
MERPRVVSLLPAATEIVAALGAGSLLAGISHECDYPPEVLSLPRVTRTKLDAALPSAEIDRIMAEAKRSGRSPIEIDLPLLQRLTPDVIIGQSVCDVCAIGTTELEHAARALGRRPRVVTLHAHDLEGVFADMRRVGEALQLADEADELVAGLRYRLRRLAHIPHPTPPRLLVLEWLDPPYVAGHWVPELVAVAGGIDVGNSAEAPSVARPWRDLAALAPDLVVIACCGFDVARARREYETVSDRDARVLFARRVEFLDGNAYTSRPGPRLVDAAELLAALMRR